MRTDLEGTDKDLRIGACGEDEILRPYACEALRRSLMQGIIFIEQGDDDVRVEN